MSKIKNTSQMTKREFWLKLFSENDTALASAILLCERFVNMEQLERGEEYITACKKSLNDIVSEELYQAVFQN